MTGAACQAIAIFGNFLRSSLFDTLDFIKQTAIH